jgi:hypothetical protein
MSATDRVIQKMKNILAIMENMGDIIPQFPTTLDEPRIYLSIAQTDICKRNAIVQILQNSNRTDSVLSEIEQNPCLQPRRLCIACYNFFLLMCFRGSREEKGPQCSARLSSLVVSHPRRRMLRPRSWAALRCVSPRTGRNCQVPSCGLWLSIFMKNSYLRGCRRRQTLCSLVPPPVVQTMACRGHATHLDAGSQTE